MTDVKQSEVDDDALVPDVDVEHETKHKKDSRKKKVPSSWAKFKETVDSKMQNSDNAQNDGTTDEATSADPMQVLESQMLRLRADFDNFRKRTMKEKSELYQRANEDVMLELLPVVDHLELALAAAAEHGADESFVSGVKLVAEQLSSALAKFGLQSIEALGVHFDHSVHEAISHMPSEEIPMDMVIAQVRRGYMLGSKLLRPAQVVVSSGNGDDATTVDDVPANIPQEQNNVEGGQ